MVALVGGWLSLTVLLALEGSELFAVVSVVVGLVGGVHFVVVVMASWSVAGSFFGALVALALVSCWLWLVWTED